MRGTWPPGYHSKVVLKWVYLQYVYTSLRWYGIVQYSSVCFKMNKNISFAKFMSRSGPRNK